MGSRLRETTTETLMNINSPVTIIGTIITNLGIVVMLQANQPEYDQAHLRALAMIESGIDDHAIGKKGERSRYQITKATWREVSNRPFSFAHRVEFATEAALHYTNKLRNRYMQDQGCAPTDEAFYVMWNWGPRKFKAVGYDMTRVPPVVLDAAHRFSNLKYMYKNLN